MVAMNDGDILGGGVDDISMWKVSIGTALGDDAVGSFWGEDVGNISGDAFHSFVSGFGDLVANSGDGDGAGWLGGIISNGGCVGYRTRE